MKKLLLFTLLLAQAAFCQKDGNGNPVFNSVITNEEVVNGLTIVSNYYTMGNNLENKGSSVYIADTPTVVQVAKAAVELPAESYVVAKNQQALGLIMVRLYPKRQLFLVYPATGKTREFDLKAKGDISQLRAEELVANGYDPKAAIANGQLTFNGKKYSIIPNEEIRKEVFAIIEAEKVAGAQLSGMMIMTQAETKAYVIKQTAEGGDFDFFIPIKGKEMDGLQIKPGVFTTNLAVALYQWGSACYDIGVNKMEDALAIYAEIKGRALNQREKDYIKMGFNKELEKE
ncbi:hypothetical protein AM493_12910 [Flavobacterium akiainvivens]|uniref:Uncharacterized protein n=1 Tax=Flavobacterium akiainvivens TaxID=1202724 RepID=A0A0M8MDW8_9FLAO|nr:hypothetical protein [Flavobacterium akiainvivens]KOS06824.1 hypothetical protein AM493_12910 [Flavobacterium akiainvivens]SFQ75172.1 hypothetical protein SAMN05444144_12126 [Flavobacterium akiainvivens]